jgi:hypothetical protein
MTAFVATRSSVLSQHAAHLLAIGIPAVMVIVGLTWDAARHRVRRTRPELPSSTALRVAAFASVVAAGIHVVVAPEHFRESALYGAFFVVAAACQLAGAVTLLAFRSRLFTGFVAGGNAVIVVLWLVTRVAGIPIGPQAGEIERFQLLDVSASTAEATVVVCCVLALHRVTRLARSVAAL